MMELHELAVKLREVKDRNDDWLDIASYVLELVNEESHERRERAKDAECARDHANRQLAEAKAELARVSDAVEDCLGLQVPGTKHSEMVQALARSWHEKGIQLGEKPHAEVLCGDLLQPVTEEEWKTLKWTPDGCEEDAANSLLAHRRDNAPRATVAQVALEAPLPFKLDNDERLACVQGVLERLGRSVVVERDKAADEEIARLTGHAAYAAQATGELQGKLDETTRELAEINARGIDPAKARAAFGLDEMRDLAPAFVAWAREYISLGRLRECIQERMIHGKWEQTWKDDEVPAESYGELAQQLDMRDAAARRARELWQARHPGDESWPDLAENIAWLVEQATVQAPGDRMSDEELARDLTGENGCHLGMIHPQKMARRARELFRPGARGPEVGTEPKNEPMTEAEEKAEAEFAWKMAPHACAFGDPEVAAKVKRMPRLCEKCGAETPDESGSVAISIWKRDRAERDTLRASAQELERALLDVVEWQSFTVPEDVLALARQAAEDSEIPF